MPAKPKRPKTVEPPEAPEPASDEQILDRFRFQATTTAGAYEEAKAKFLERFADDPEQAYTWAADKLLKLQGEHWTWSRTIDLVDDSRGSVPLPEIMSTLAADVQGEVNHIVDGQLWRRLTSSAIGDACESARLSGRAKALSSIREMCRWATGEIQKREG